MEKTPGKQEMSVRLPTSYIRNIYSVLLVANNRANWHPDELVPVGNTLQELKAILQKIKEEEVKGTTMPKVPEEVEGNEEETKNEEVVEESKENDD